MSSATNMFGLPRFGRSANTHLDFGTGQTTATLKAALSTAYKIFVKRIVVWIKTDAAQSITFEDSAATPIVVCKVPSSPGADTRWDFYFPGKGKPLTVGKDLKATFSAAGLAGHITVEAYQTDFTAAQ